MLLQQGLCLFQVKLPRFFLVYAAIEPAKQRILQNGVVHTCAAPQYLGRGETAQLRSGGLRLSADGGIKRTGGNIAKGQTVAVIQPINTCHVIVFALVKHAAFGDGTRGDDPGDIPLHDALGQGRIFRLLANGDFVALGNQTGNVGIHAVIGNTAHGSLFFLRLVPVTGGQCQIQFFSSQLGIFVEHLIEVAQSEKQDTVFILFLDGVILTLHGRQFIFFFSHNHSSSFSWPVRLQVVAPVMVTQANLPMFSGSPGRRTSRPPSVRAVSSSLSLPSIRQRRVLPI